MARDQGGPVSNKLNMSEQCAAGAKEPSGVLGCINRGISSRDYPILVCQATPGIMLLVSCSLLYKKDMDRLERVERRATEMIKDDQKPDI